MSSSKEYCDYILDQLSHINGISCRPMMGEYILYYNGKIFGGIYDDRFLIKAVPSAVKIMSEAQYELPYDGAKEMILVDKTDDREFLEELLNAMYGELPVQKKK